MHKPSLPLTPPTPPKLPEPLFNRLGLRGWRLPALLVIGFVAWNAGSWWRDLAPYELPAVVNLPELGSPVGISRDDFSIPTIRAQSERDAYFALGFLHAQDRLWMMEVMRRIAAGRLAEIAGPDSLPSDRFMRALNARDSVRKTFPKLDAEVRTALRMYAAGVNAWIAQGHLPPEFTVLGYKPEPWQETDSLLVADLMATQLMSDWRDGLLQTQLFTLFGERARDLWPHTSATDVLAGIPLSPRLAAVIPPEVEPRTASNIWIVNGSHTASGKPLLANDTHLWLTEIPVVWHLSTILSPTLTVSGAAIPGIPFHLVAHNERMAWGITVTHASTADLVVERSDDGQNWQSTTGLKPFIWRDEIIKVKGEADHVFRVRNTDHGPVLSDLIAEDDPLHTPEIVSLQTPLFRGDNLSMRALYILNRAADLTSARQALADAQAPVLNFGLASVDGDIALQTVGQVPLRHPDNQGIFPVDGGDDIATWRGVIPYAAMPATVNPPSGIIANTNSAVVGSDYPYVIGPYYWSGETRVRRLWELLNAAPKDMTWEDMAAIQGDTVSTIARDLLPRLLAAVPSDNPWAQKLRGWDGAMDKDKPQPLIFHAWTDALWLSMVGDRLKGTLPYLRTPRQPALLQMLNHPQDWCGGNSCDSVIAAALTTAVHNLEQRFGSDPQKWQWGMAHRGHLHNSVLERIPFLSRFVNVVFPMDGDDATLNRATLQPETLEVVQAATLRAIFDLDDLWQSRFILATGQSGHPLSPHYRDQLPLWQANRTTPLHAPQQRTLLKPKP